MESELCISPLFVRRNYLASKYWLKCRSIRDNVTIDLLDELSYLLRLPYWQKKKKPLLVTVHNSLRYNSINSTLKLEMFSMNTWVSSINLVDVLEPNIRVMDKPKKCYNPIDLRFKCSKYLDKKYLGFYKLFSDGSLMNDGRGAAFIDAENGNSMKFLVKSKICIMHLELIALSEALSYIESINSDKFVIFTDSKSAMFHLSRCVSGSSFRGVSIAYSIINNIRCLISKNKCIKIQYIPSHVGLVGNQEVDILAKEATSDGEIINCLPNFTDLVPYIKNCSFNIWSEYFDERSLTKGIWYKVIQPSLPRSPWFLSADMDRNEIVTAVRVRSGHVPLNMFGHMMGKTESATCARCGTIEDVYHVLMECALNDDLRRQLFDRNHVFWQLGGCNNVLTDPASPDARGLYNVYRAAVRQRKLLL